MEAKGLTTVKALKDELAKLKTLSSYQQFVSDLPQNAIIGTLNTDDKGQDSVVLQMHTSTDSAIKNDGVTEPTVKDPVDNEDEIEAGEVDDNSDGSYERTGVVDGKDVTMPEGAAEFALYDAADLEDAKPVCTLVTGTDGMYELDKIDTSGDNVTIGDDKKSAVVVIGKDKNGEIYSTGTVGFYNVAYKGSIKVIKYSDDDKEKPLKDVTFTLYDSNSSKVAEKETDENGEILFSGRRRAAYILKETKTLPGYLLLKISISITIPKTLTAEEAKA